MTSGKIRAYGVTKGMEGMEERRGARKLKLLPDMWLKSHNIRDIHWK